MLGRLVTLSLSPGRESKDARFSLWASGRAKERRLSILKEPGPGSGDGIGRQFQLIPPAADTAGFSIRAAGAAAIPSLRLDLRRQVSGAGENSSGLWLALSAALL
jgi:hypothetical protein